MRRHDNANDLGARDAADGGGDDAGWEVSTYRLKATVLVRVECQGAPGLQHVGPPMAVEVPCGLGREHYEHALTVDADDVEAGVARAGWTLSEPSAYHMEISAWCPACEAARRA